MRGPGRPEHIHRDCCLAAVQAVDREFPTPSRCTSGNERITRIRLIRKDNSLAVPQCVSPMGHPCRSSLNLFFTSGLVLQLTWM